MLDDIRHTLRFLRRTPTLTVPAVGTLAIALGASTAVFSVVDKVLVRPLPFLEPDRVVVIWPRERANPTTIGEISHATYRDWQDDVRSFEALAAIGSVNWSLVLAEGEPETVPIAAVSASFFPLLGASPTHGRMLEPSDDQRGAELVAVMSHGMWTSRFAADRGIVGRRLRFREGTYTVIGVMPERFDYPRGANLWVAVVPQLDAANATWKVGSL